MGGAADVDLLFDIVRLTGATKVIETGVAYGWSSFAILHAMSINYETGASRGELFSVDMPYPNRGNDQFVGIVVPDRYRQGWTLFREPDRLGLLKAIEASGGHIDLCHYDSDKNWWGRAYAFPIMWDALRSGGVFISDDIQDNFFFSHFVEEKQVPFAVTKSQGKFIGLIRKP
jgi:predicted O-methyltransferase YrrM